MGAPAISVLLPMRNVAPWLAPCLQSLRDQSFRDFEVIGIDDGSADATAEIFERTTRGDSRFSLVPARQQGLAAALNQAAEQTSAPWLARMDGDDVCDLRRFELQLEFARNNAQLDVIGSLVQIFPEPLSVGMSRYQGWLGSRLTHQQMLSQIFVESPLAHPSVLIRRSAFESAGGYEDRGWAEDYDLWLRLIEQGRQLGKVPEMLLYWRDRQDRTSRTAIEYRADRFRACKLHYLRRWYPLEDGCIVLGAGPTGKPWGRLLMEAGIPVRCFMDVSPRRIGETIDGIPVVSPDRLGQWGPAVLLGAVGQAGGRERLEEWFLRSNPVAGQVLVLVA